MYYTVIIKENLFNIVLNISMQGFRRLYAYA